MSYIMQAEDFNIVDDSYSRKMLINAYDAITMEDGGWDFMKNFNEESFMFSRNPMVNKISNNMATLGFDGHSGASFGWAMRSMEYLAKNGKEAFISKFDQTAKLTG